MELSVIQPSESILEIVHPGTGAKLGITVSLRSIDDEAMKKAKRLIQDASLKLQKRGKLFTAEEIDENQSVLMFTAMTGWNWVGITVVDEPERTEKRTIVDEPAKTIQLPADEMGNFETAEIPPVTHTETVIIPAKTHLEPANFHGEKPAFNRVNVMRVFEELPWFRDQITEKVGDTSSFFTK